MDSSNESKRKFQECMNGVCEYYDKKPFSKMTLMIYFEALADYSFDEITYAISKHMRDSERGGFIPRVSDLERHLAAAKPTTSEIIALARLKNCPLGVIAGTHIDASMLKNLQHNELIDFAAEVLVKFDEYLKMARTGYYPDHLLLRMDALGVSPLGPFMPGMPPPQGDVKSTIEARLQIAKNEQVKRLGNLSEADDEEQERKRAELTLEQMAENRKRVVGMFRNLFSENTKGDV